MKFKIKINGSGTVKEITNALDSIVDSLNSVDENEQDAILDGAVWEGSVLMVEISAE